MGDAKTGAVFLSSDDWDRWQDDPNLHAVRWNGHIVLVNRLSNLAACLREAAGLTKSWRLGVSRGTERYSNVNEATTWHPGCGRAAPGWTVK